MPYGTTGFFKFLHERDTLPCDVLLQCSNALPRGPLGESDAPLALFKSSLLIFSATPPPSLHPVRFRDHPCYGTRVNLSF